MIKGSRRTGSRLAGTAALLGAWVAGGCAGDPADLDAQRAELEAHRAQRIERLSAEDGWLSLAGLFWLEVGENPFGSGTHQAVVLPADAAPESCGAFHYDGSAVRLAADPHCGITLDGEALTEGLLADDEGQAPDVLELGRLRLYVVQRSGRHGIRVKDPQSAARREFSGLDFFPFDPEYRVRGTLQRYEEPREMVVPTVIGTPSRMLALGVVEFELRGSRCRLIPLVSTAEETRLFFIFRDGTSGIETYPAGRYLYADLEGRTVWLDFNRAYNPPCAFTPFATCPLPPPENRLAPRIEAGEMNHHAEAKSSAGPKHPAKGATAPG